TAGTPGGMTVTAQDLFGNTATGYAGTVHFSSSDPQARLPADYTFTAADAGSHSFNLSLDTAGTQAITAADAASSSLSGTPAGIAATRAAATPLAPSGLGSPVTAGAAGSATVTARDPFGNVATAYAGTIHFTSTDAQAALPGNYTFTGGDAGVHTFTSGVTL